MKTFQQPLLTIQVPTVEGRENEFNKLKDEIFRQGEATGSFEDGSLGFISLKDKKEITIGAKRRQLYESSKGLYSWQIDDDDDIHKHAIEMILDEIIANPGIDCITFKELCIFDGTRVQSSNHSLKYKQWQDNHDGYNHVRTPFFKDVIRTELCRTPGLIPDIRYSEDHEFAKNIYPLLKTEKWINEFIYVYQHNASPMNERYGIK